jgi:CubicO group peptidase (beta-lactamase class C family)
VTGRKAVGIAVGLTGVGGRRFITAGRRSDADPHPPAADSVFQIGSITKTFTSAVLMDMVLKGEVALDQPVAELLPKDVKVPTRHDRQITLVDLATHTAGLPRDPDGFSGPDGDDWAGFTDAVLLRLLPNWRPATDIGTTYAYSNTGVALLALALRRRAGGLPYETLVRRRVLEPLGMADTRINPTGAMKRRFVPGFGDDLKPTTLWRMDQAISGVGGLVSTTDDLLAWLEANMGATPTPLGPVLKAQLSVRRKKPPMPEDKGPREVAIGLHIDHRLAGDVVWHDGGTNGYRAFAGWNPAVRTGVVILANSNATDLHDLAFWALGTAHAPGG